MIAVVFVLQIFTTKQLEDDLSKIANVLSNDKADWELRVTAVSTKKTILQGWANLHSRVEAMFWIGDGCNNGPVHKGTNHVPKAVSERDSDPSWFESLILPFVNAKLFQIRLLKRKTKGVLDRDPPRKPDFTLCERKALSERDSCVRILELCALKPCMGQSAQ